MVSSNDLLDAAFASYQDGVQAPPAGFTQSTNPLHTINNSSTGLYVTTYHNPATNEYIVAFRGTEFTSGNDWANNANRGWPQYEQNQAQIQGLLNGLTAGGSQISITGHSLGGGLAQFAAYDYANSNPNASNEISLTTWNALGGKWALQEYRNFDPSVMDGMSATHYYRYDDLVSRLGEGHVGGSTIELRDPDGVFDHIGAAHGKAALQEGLALGGSNNSPDYISISDAGQSVVGNFSDGFLSISNGNWGEGLANLAEGIIPILNPIDRIWVAKDLGVIIGNVIYHEAPAGIAWVKDQVKQFTEAVVETAVDAAETAAMIGQTALELAKQGVVEANDLINSIGEAVAETIADAVEAAQTVADVIGEFITDGYYNAKDFLNSFLDDAGNWFNNTASDFQAAINTALRRLIDPLVVDMDGDGIELTARADSNVVFDMDGDGVKEWTGWIGKDDAFLVIDENLNGKVDSITELIGDQGRSGFTELSTYDSNGDQTINSSDAIWPKLLLWRDSNSNGTTNTGELLTLTAGDIKSVDLHYTTVNFTAEGNRIHESSIFEKISGGVGALVDAWLDVSNVAQPLGALTTGNVTVDMLPNIRNYGDVTTLRKEMVNDTALTTLVNTVVNLQPDQLAGIKGQTEQILFRWANTNDVAVDSRGVNFDGRVLATLEKFLGTPYAVNANPNPTVQAVPGLTRAWNSVVDGVQSRLLLEGPLKDHTPPVVYNEGSDRFITLGTIDDVINGIKHVQFTDTLARANFWSAVIPVINRLADDAGIDPASLAHRNKIDAALGESGLGKFQDLLRSGVLTAVLPASGILDKNGVFQLSNTNEITYLAGSIQGVFGLGGNDQLIVTNASASIMLDGGSGDDVLQGSESADWLDGGLGADLMKGLGGNDTYIVDNVGDVVVENRNEGTDTVNSSVSYVLGNNVENLILSGTDGLSGVGNTLNNILTGNSGANALTGNAGSDTLDGGAGADALTGGTGDDVYYVDNAGDTVTEAFNAGTDRVYSSISYTLTANMENLNLLGVDNLNGTGNGLNNTLVGNGGANILNGGNGSDSLQGGAGDDTYVVESSGDSVSEGVSAGIDTVHSGLSYTLGSNVENLMLTGVDNFSGIGNSLDNQLTGNSGANTLDGGIGIDTMTGGAGEDTYYIDNIGDSVVEGANAGDDTVRSGVSYTLGANVENLILTGSAILDGTGNGLANIITGNSAANILKGNAGNDTLDGGVGADTLVGGVGDDTYVVDNAADTATEGLNAGIDTIVSSVSWILGNNIENLTLAGSGSIDGSGNALGNRLTGNDGVNVLDGQAGVDVLTGWAGNDTYIVDNAGDVVVESRNEGTDTVNSSVSYVLGDNVENLILSGTDGLSGTGNTLNNILTGNAGENQLDGGNGNDMLDGNAGNDLLTGGAGFDVFRFTTTGHIDTITDFIVADDTIQLENAVFTLLTTTGTLAASQFVIGADALDANDFIIYNNATGALLYDADGNGISVAAQIATVGVGLAMTNTDFVVI